MFFTKHGKKSEKINPYEINFQSQNTDIVSLNTSLKKTFYLLLEYFQKEIILSHLAHPITLKNFSNFFILEKMGFKIKKT